MKTFLIWLIWVALLWLILTIGLILLAVRAAEEPQMIPSSYHSSL